MVIPILPSLPTKGKKKSILYLMKFWVVLLVVLLEDLIELFRVVGFEISYLIGKPSVGNSMSLIKSKHSFPLNFVPHLFKGLLGMTIFDTPFHKACFQGRKHVYLFFSTALLSISLSTLVKLESKREISIICS